MDLTLTAALLAVGTGAISVQAGAALDLSIAGAQTLNQNVTGAGILRKSGNTKHAQQHERC